MQSNLLYLRMKLSLFGICICLRPNVKAMRKCCALESLGWRGEDPKLGKQTVEKLNLKTKSKQVVQSARQQSHLFEIEYKYDCLIAWQWLWLPSFLLWEQELSEAWGHDKNSLCSTRTTWCHPTISPLNLAGAKDIILVSHPKSSNKVSKSTRGVWRTQSYYSRNLVEKYSTPSKTTLHTCKTKTRKL